MKLKHNLIRICLLGVVWLSAFDSEAQLTVTKIAAGDFHTLFLRSDGSLWGMGYNGDGELGDGTFNNRVIPEQIVAGGVTAIAAGGSHSLFLKSDGSLWAMGANNTGQLGDGTLNNANAPEMIVSSNVTAIAAGGQHSLFLKSDGSLWAMGNNGNGQLGDGTTDNGNYYVASPEEIVTNEVTAIAAGNGHSLFIKKSGTKFNVTTELWGMGDETFGELGNGVGCISVSQLFGTGFSNIFTNVPVMIERATGGTHPVGVPVTAIAAGGEHSLFIKSDGSLWAMGDDDFGQLGDGVTSPPFNQIGTNRPEEIEISGVAAIAAGNHHSMFLNSDGSLWAMGENSIGQLGDGTENNRNLPEEILTGGVAAISAGYVHSLFIKTDGNLWVMGDGAFGQLGDGGSGEVADGDDYSSLVPELITIVPAPALGITSYGGRPLVIFTNPASTNYTLQMTTNLLSGNWVPVTNEIPINAVQIPTAAGTVFFRLH